MESSSATVVKVGSHTAPEVAGTGTEGEAGRGTGDDLKLYQLLLPALDFENSDSHKRLLHEENKYALKLAEISGEI